MVALEKAGLGIHIPRRSRLPHDAGKHDSITRKVKNRIIFRLKGETDNSEPGISGVCRAQFLKVPLRNSLSGIVRKCLAEMALFG
jgi:hypothetical protein